MLGSRQVHRHPYCKVLWENCYKYSRDRGKNGNKKLTLVFFFFPLFFDLRQLLTCSFAAGKKPTRLRWYLLLPRRLFGPYIDVSSRVCCSCCDDKFDSKSWAIQDHIYPPYTNAATFFRDCHFRRRQNALTGFVFIVTLPHVLGLLKLEECGQSCHWVCPIIKGLTSIRTKNAYLTRFEWNRYRRLCPWLTNGKCLKQYWNCFKIDPSLRLRSFEKE